MTRKIVVQQKRRLQREGAENVALSHFFVLSWIRYSMKSKAGENQSYINEPLKLLT